MVHWPSSIDDSVPQLSMPPLAQGIATVVFSVGALVVGYACWRVAARSRSNYPWALYVGAGLTVPYETFDGVLGHFVYSQRGMHQLLSLYGHPLPLFILPIYLLYVTPGILWIFYRMERGGFSRRLWWATFGTSALFAMCFEPPFINAGLWTYYGANQPFRILGLPFWWIITNEAMLLCAGVLCWAIYQHILRPWGPRAVWLLALLVPFSVFGVHTAFSAPIFAALNTSDSATTANIAGLASNVLALVGLAIAARVAVRVTEPAPGSEPIPVAHGG